MEPATAVRGSLDQNTSATTNAQAMDPRSSKPGPKKETDIERVIKNIYPWYVQATPMFANRSHACTHLLIGCSSGTRLAPLLQVT
jgi:hypothetical protein